MLKLSEISSMYGVNIFLFFLVLGNTSLVRAQAISYGGVASLMGRANTGVAAISPWAAFYNPAGLANADTMVSIGLNTVYNPSWQGWDQQSIMAFVPFENKGLSLSASHFGDMLYQENSAGAAIGSKIRQFSLGAGIRYWQVSIQDYGSSGNAYLDFGGQVHVNHKLIVGAHIFNFTQAKIKGEWANSTPVILKAGFSYHVSNQILAFYEINKSVIAIETHRIALSYQLSHFFALRAGIALQPVQYSAGCGIKLPHVGVDLAFLQEKILGYQMGLSLYYRFSHFLKRRKY